MRWWPFVRCQELCAQIDREAESLFGRGELVAALALIDRTDARCRCSRYTSGDAPAQYAIAEACLQQLLREQRTDELRRILSAARGPIIKSLLRVSPEYRAVLERDAV